uniref:BTB domain-containing protein n=1 Tax=Plectus sambesii TaxID=2011161 RepID=A0A914UK54_9BILA
MANFSYSWTISTKIYDDMKFGESLTSRRFITVKDHASYAWCLKMYPKGMKLNNHEVTDLCTVLSYISGPRDFLYIGTVASPYPQLTSTFCIAIANQTTGNVQFRKCAKGEESAPSSRIQANSILNFVSKDASKNMVLSCSIQVQVFADVFNQLLTLPLVLEPLAVSPFDQLLGKVVSGADDELSDFSILSSDGHTYATDRRILSNRCIYFEQLFLSAAEKWIEKSSNQFQAPFSKRAMDELLNYIYTDRVNIPKNENATDVPLLRELVSAADYFQLFALKQHYERPLLENLLMNQSGITALSLFIFAERYGFKVLKNSALSVLCSKYDSIEEEVQRMSSDASVQHEKEDSNCDKTCESYDSNKNCAENGSECNFLSLWNELKKTRRNNTSLFDEVFTFSRQSNVTQL